MQQGEEDVATHQVIYTHAHTYKHHTHAHTHAHTCTHTHTHSQGLIDLAQQQVAQITKGKMALGEAQMMLEKREAARPPPPLHTHTVLHTHTRAPALTAHTHKHKRARSFSHSLAPYAPLQVAKKLQELLAQLKGGHCLHMKFPSPLFAHRYTHMSRVPSLSRRPQGGFS